MTPAGFWRRSAAWTLDFAVIAAVVVAAAWAPLKAGWLASVAATCALSDRTADALFEGMMDGTPVLTLVPALLRDPRLLEAAATLQSALWQLSAPFLIGYMLLALPWHVGGELSRWQGSPGKRLLGLKVTDLAGEPLSLSRALLRHATGLLSWLTLNLGHAVAMLPPEKRALHDRLAGTRVLRR